MTKPNPLDLVRLREVAEAATRGPWSAKTHGLPKFNNVEHFVVSDHPGVHEGDALICTTNLLDPADAAFIAAFNPATALALLDALSRSEAERERLRQDAINDVADAMSTLPLTRRKLEDAKAAFRAAIGAANRKARSALNPEGER